MNESLLEHQYGLSALWHVGWFVALFPSIAIAVYAEFRYLENSSTTEIVALTDFRLGAYARVLAASILPSLFGFYLINTERPVPEIVEWLAFAWITFLLILLLRFEQSKSDMMPKDIFSFKYSFLMSFLYTGYICSFYWVKATMQVYE